MAFSDKRINVDGVEIKPKWPWSSAYRAAVRATVLAMSRSDVSDADRARQYCKAYAAQNETCPLIPALKFGLWEAIAADDARKVREARRHRARFI